MLIRIWPRRDSGTPLALYGLRLLQEFTKMLRQTGMETVRATVPIVSDISSTAKQSSAYRLCPASGIRAHIQPRDGFLQHHLCNLRQALGGRKDLADSDSVVTIHNHCFSAGNHPPAEN